MVWYTLQLEWDTHYELLRKSFASFAPPPLKKSAASTKVIGFCTQRNIRATPNTASFEKKMLAVMYMCMY